MLDEAGLAGAAKTSGAKGVHVFVPLAPATPRDVAAATRAIAARAERLDSALATTAFIVEERHGKVFLDSTRAGGATVVAAYSPRVRPGVPVSFPVPWDDLDRVTPADFTLRTVPDLSAGGDPWAELMPAPQTLPADLVAEGHDDPDRPGPGHARGQAASPRPAGRRPSLTAPGAQPPAGSRGYRGGPDPRRLLSDPGHQQTVGEPVVPLPAAGRAP